MTGHNDHFDYLWVGGFILLCLTLVTLLLASLAAILGAGPSDIPTVVLAVLAIVTASYGLGRLAIEVIGL